MTWTIRSHAAGDAALSLSQGSLPRQPGQAGVQDELGAVLEVHAIDVVPLAAPQEAAPLTL